MKTQPVRTHPGIERGSQVEDEPTYQSFLVRIWRERSQTHPAKVIGRWEGEIEHIQTGKRWSFESVERLFAFLRQHMEKAHKER